MQLPRRRFLRLAASLPACLATLPVAPRIARAAADGYTLLVTGGSHVNNPFLYSHVPYDPFRDFEAVTLGASQAVVLTVHPSVPAQTVKELVALVKANPGKYSFASPGAGT